MSSGDGSIDETEFSKVCNSHGVEEAEAREAFKKLGVVSINQAEEKDNDEKKGEKQTRRCYNGGVESHETVYSLCRVQR